MDNTQLVLIFLALIVILYLCINLLSSKDKEKFSNSGCTVNTDCTGCIFSRMPSNFSSYGGNYFCGQNMDGSKSCQRTYTANNGQGYWYPCQKPASAPSQLITPNTLKAKFYEHCDYQGAVWELGIGDYSWIGALGISNDAISSLRVPPGLKVTLYEHSNFQGRSLDLTSDSSCLVGQRFNDLTSSIKISSI